MRLVDGEPRDAEAGARLAASPFMASLSGETKSSRSSRRSSACQISSDSPAPVIEFSVAAATPKRLRSVTWSRISASSGETTSVRPPPAMAGSW